jgi:hypothetical protein
MDFTWVVPNTAGYVFQSASRTRLNHTRVEALISEISVMISCTKITGASTWFFGRGNTSGLTHWNTNQRTGKDGDYGQSFAYRI